MKLTRVLVTSAALVTVLVATATDATDGIHPRTPVLWEDPPSLPEPACLTTVDRSSDPVLVLNYTIPFEDTDITPHEVDDSRRHQFLAMCRSISPALPPPNWLSEADVAAAAAKELAVPSEISDDDILDLAPAWAGCFTRITGDDERRPITFEMADTPVPFDTTNLAPGPWTVWGYTWEPPFNLWSLRTGVVNVVDDPTDDTNLPAMALQIAAGEEPIYFKGDTAHFEACVAAMDGSTVTLEWAPSETQPTWNVLDPELPVVDGMNNFEFGLPEESVGMSIMLRAVITDPMNRTYTSYFREPLAVLDLASTTGDCGSDGGTFIADPGCGGSSGTDAGTTGPQTTSDTGSSTDTDTDTDTGDSTGMNTGGGGGCQVGADPGPPRALWALALVAFFGRKRRQ